MSLQSRNKVSVTFSMSSLTDIVFLLLIFFIILSTLVNQHGENVDLPKGTQTVAKNPDLTVTITKDLRYQLNTEYVPKEQIAARVAALTEGKPKPQLRLKVDKSVPSGETIEFIGLCRENGFGIVVATQRKK